MFMKVDKGRGQHNGGGPKRYSSPAKNVPVPPPKPNYARGTNSRRESRESEKRHGSDSSTAPVQPPPLPLASSSKRKRNGHGHSDSEAQYADRYSVSDVKEGSLTSFSTHEDEMEYSRHPSRKSSEMGNGVRRVKSKRSKEVEDKRLEEKIQVDTRDEDADDEEEEEDCCLSPKDLIMLKIKPACAKGMPFLLTLLMNLLGVFIGAAIVYATMRMGLTPSSILSMPIRSYRPIESYAVSPISGIRSESLQPWITFDLNPILTGIKQLDSNGEEIKNKVFSVDSISVVLNITHESDESSVHRSISDAMNASRLLSATGTRSHLVSFRVKRQVVPAEVISDDNEASEYTSALTDAVETSVDVIHEQIGNETRFEAFIPLIKSVQEKLTHILLRYVIISPQQLLESLKYAKFLRVLEMDQVQLLGYFDGRAQLPALTKFSLHVVNSSSLIATAAPIKTYLFFDKDGYWRLEKITSLGVDIELIFDGRKYLGINHSKGQLISQLLMTNTILEHVRMNDHLFRLRNLGLSFIELNTDLIPPTIQYLSLSAVTFKPGQSLKKLLGKLTELRSLELSNVSAVALKVSDLPHSTLKHLAFGRSSLKYRPDVLFDLDSLYLDNVKGDEELFLKFNSVFNTTRIAVSGLPSAVQSHTFLKKILQMTAVQWIYMENFDRNDTANMTNEMGNSDYTEMEWFLISAGVPSMVEVFLLEKNTTSGNWKGAGVTIEQHKHLWFDLFGMDKFWTRSSVDILNRMKGQKFITYYLSKHDEPDVNELKTMTQ